MPSEVRNAVKNCQKCIKHEFNSTKEQLHPIIATAPLDLVHIDFTSIEVSGDDNLHTTPTVVPVLVITHHFTRHFMAFITKDQKASTIAKKFYENYICTFGAPTRLHSDQGANFTSTVIAELCSLLGIQKSKMTPYCPQSNGKVERMHQTLIRMIGKLPDQKKVNWPAHLPEVIQAYNSTQSAITGYSPHYLMFGWRPRFPINLYFPTLRGETEKFCVNHYVADIQQHLKQALEIAQKHNKNEALWQKHYFDHLTGTVVLWPGDIVLLCTNSFVGKRKMKDKWSNATYEVVHQCSGDSPMYVVKDEQGWEKKYHQNHLLFVASIGTDSDAKPQAEPLATGSSDDCTNVSDSMPKDVTPDGNSNESGSNQILAVRNTMAAVHSHDSEGPMGWIGKGFNTLSKALTGVLSKEEGQVTWDLKGTRLLQLQLPMRRHP